MVESMNNKPVAWMLVDEINGDYMLERHPSGDYDWIPLYTHPVKDIIEKNKPEIEKANAYIKSLEDEIEILRKAQEKC